LHFILLFKFRGKPPRDLAERVEELSRRPPPGFKPYGFYWTLGSLDAVWHVEAESVPEALLAALRFREIADVEVLPALPLGEVSRLLEKPD